MTILNKIDLLIESTLSHEQRFILQVNNFNSLKNKNSVDYRMDWYFDKHRIRHIVQKGPGLNLDVWQKIDSSQNTKATKKKITIKPQNQDKLDKESNFKIHVISKRPMVDGKELYLEKATVSNDKRTVEFITTEAESTEDLDRIKLMTKLPQIKGVKSIGAVSMKSIALNKLK